MPLMRPFHPCCGGCRGSLPGLESVNQPGSVKIIDTFALGAVLAIQSRRAQTVECTVEFGFNRGVNELDMGEGAGALWFRAAASQWRARAACSYARSCSGRSDATAAGAGTGCSVLGSRLY